MSDLTPKLPEVKFSKNGYEIRADVLQMAKDHVQNEFNFKMHGWEVSAKRDPVTQELVSSVAMPEFPGLEKVLEAAEKFYSFVNTGTKK